MGATTKKSDMTFRNAEFGMKNPGQEMKNPSEYKNIHTDDNSEDNYTAE